MWLVHITPSPIHNVRLYSQQLKSTSISTILNNEASIQELNNSKKFCSTVP